MNNCIGNKLRELRGCKTQEIVARDLGISPSSWAMYESGARVPRDEIKVKIASYFNRTVGEIFLQTKTTFRDFNRCASEQRVERG